MLTESMPFVIIKMKTSDEREDSLDSMSSELIFSYSTEMETAVSTVFWNGNSLCPSDLRKYINLCMELRHLEASSNGQVY